MNYFRLFPLQTHYKLTVIKFILISIKKSTHLLRISQHTSESTAQWRYQETRFETCCQIAPAKLPKCKIVHCVTSMKETLRTTENSVWCITETVDVDGLEIYFHLRKLPLDIALSNFYGRRQPPSGNILTFFEASISPLLK